MKNDDFDLPTPPELYDDEYNPEDGEQVDPSKIQDTSPLVLELNYGVEKIEDADFNHLTLHNLEKALLKSELADSNMYLKNLHKGFKFARSTRSLIALVGAGLAVHKHRRNVIKEIKDANKNGIFELDDHGNPKS